MFQKIVEFPLFFANYRQDDYFLEFFELSAINPYFLLEIQLQFNVRALSIISLFDRPDMLATGQCILLAVETLYPRHRHA